MLSFNGGRGGQGRSGQDDVMHSENMGIVSLVVDGEVTVMFDQNELRDNLAGLLNLKVSFRKAGAEESLDAV